MAIKKSNIPLDPFVASLRKPPPNEQQELLKKKARQAQIKDAAQEFRDAEANKKYGEELDKNLKSLSEPGGQSYNTWATSMMNILTSLHSFVNYTHTKLKGTTPRPVWNKAEHNTLNITPDVAYSVKMDDTNKVETKVYADGKTLGGQQKAQFDTGLHAWAMERGYKMKIGDPDHPHPDDGKFFNARGEVWAKADFDAKKMDATDGLQPFLQKRFAMTLTDMSPPAETPAPRP